MTEDFTDFEESYQTVLDISKTISKSKEVVNQSKILWNRLKCFNNTLPHEYRSLDQSLTDISQLSPTVRGCDTESCYLKENSILKSRLEEMQKEIFALKEKVQLQQEMIDSYEVQLVGSGKVKLQQEIIDSYEERFGSGKGLECRKNVSLRFCSEDELGCVEKNGQEERLKSISSLYEKQVEINYRLQEKFKEIKSGDEEIKIAKIEEKIVSSNKRMKKLTKRLEKTESILSKNTSPVMKVRKSGFLVHHKNKKLGKQ